MTLWSADTCLLGMYKALIVIKGSVMQPHFLSL